MAWFVCLTQDWLVLFDVSFIIAALCKEQLFSVL